MAMSIKFRPRMWPSHDRRRQSTPEERVAWEEQRRRADILEREEIERRLSYLEYQMRVLMGEDS